MEEERSKKIFTIPNILSLFRFVLAFVFAYVYLNASTTREYYIAALIIVLSGLTDVIDGKIARHFHMISELGKILDPVADKFTQGIVALCLIKRFPLMLVLFVIFILKESYMAIRGIMVLKATGKNSGALWFGKMNTVIMYAVLFLMLAIPGMPLSVSNILIIFCICVMFFTFFMYAKTYHQLIKQYSN